MVSYIGFLQNENLTYENITWLCCLDFHCAHLLKKKILLIVCISSECCFRTCHHFDNYDWGFFPFLFRVSESETKTSSKKRDQFGKTFHKLTFLQGSVLIACTVLAIMSASQSVFQFWFGPCGMEFLYLPQAYSLCCRVSLTHSIPMIYTSWKRATAVYP